MKEYHFGFKVSSYLFDKYPDREGKHNLKRIPENELYSIISKDDTIYSIYIGFEESKLMGYRYEYGIRAYLKTEAYKNPETGRTDYGLLEKRREFMVPCVFVVNDGTVIDEYPLMDCYEKVNYSIDDINIHFDFEEFKHGNSSYVYFRIETKESDSRKWPNVQEHELLARLLKKRYSQLRLKRIVQTETFEELYRPLQMIEEQVESYDLESILQDLSIHVSFPSWKGETYIKEERHYSYEYKKLDSFLSFYLSSVKDEYLGRNVYSNKGDPFDEGFCSPNIFGRPGPYISRNSFGGFNNWEQERIIQNNGDYYEDQVDIVREQLIKKYSKDYHKRYLLEMTKEWRDWSSDTYACMNRISFFDLLTDPSFYHRIDSLIGAAVYKVKIKSYSSISELMTVFNDRLRQCNWLWE